MIYLVVRILILWFYNLNYDGSLIIILIDFVLAISLARIIIPNIIIIREGKDCLIFLMEERFIDVPFRAWAEFAFSPPYFLLLRFWWHYARRRDGFSGWMVPLNFRNFYCCVAV